MALKPRHRKFVDALLAGETQEKAAIIAGSTVATSRSEGARLLAIPSIRAEYDKGLAIQQRASEKRAAEHGVTKEWWLTSLKQIADADMDAFLEIEQYLKYQGKSGKKYYGQRARAIATKFRKAGLGQLIKKISETKNGIGIELHSKQFAYELLGSHFGWKTENVHHTGGVAHVVGVVDPDVLAAALKKIKDEY